MSVTLDQLVEVICVSINNYLETTRQRIKLLIPSSVALLLSKYQWEFTTRLAENLVTVANQEWMEVPETFDKVIIMWRSNWEKPIEFLTTYQYGQRKALSSTPYGQEAIKYTVIGSDEGKRIYFLDPPTSAHTIKMFYSVRIDPQAIQILPDEFVQVVKSYILYQMIPPVLQIGGVTQPNPGYRVARDDYVANLGDLISREKTTRDRLVSQVIDDVSKNAYKYFHR